MGTRIRTYAKSPTFQPQDGPATTLLARIEGF